MMRLVWKHMFVSAISLVMCKSAIFHVAKNRHALTLELTEQATCLSAADLTLEMHWSTNCHRNAATVPRNTEPGGSRLAWLMAENLCSITPLLIKLHWLQMGVRVELKSLPLTVPTGRPSPQWIPYYILTKASQLACHASVNTVPLR